MVHEDPKQRLTTWLTSGLAEEDEIQHLDRTRLLFPGQKEWIAGMLALDDPYFTKRVERDCLIMCSFRGRRSDDVVMSLTHLDEMDSIEAGLRPISDAIKAQQKGKRRTEE